MKDISKHITYNEAVYSDTAKRLGIKNTPNEEQLVNMKIVANFVFEPLYRHFNTKIGISSFYRSKALNKAVNGSKSSQHIKGEAIDIDADIFGKITNKQIFDFIKDNLEFDQLIYEYGTDENPDWVHVSYTIDRPNRKQMLRTSKVNGKPKTETYSVRNVV